MCMQGRVLKTQQQHKQAVELIADSFYRNHPLWNFIPPDPHDVERLLRYKIVQADKADLVWGFFVGNVMVAVALFYHLQDYLKQSPPKAKNSKLFDIYQPYFAQLEQNVISQRKPNRITYFSDYIAVRPELVAKGYGLLAYLEAFKMGREFGCDDIFARMTNPINKHIAEFLGFAVVKEVELSEEGFKGKKLQMLYMPDVKGFRKPALLLQPKL